MITIDLNKLKDEYFEEEEKLFKQCIEDVASIETINDVIKIIVENEFYYYTIEDLIPNSIYNTAYKKITQEQFIELQQKKVIPLMIEYSNGMYINFEYKNGKYVNDQLGEDYLNQNKPGLFYIKKNIIMYYFLNGKEYYLDPDYTGKNI